MENIGIGNYLLDYKTQKAREGILTKTIENINRYPTDDGGYVFPTGCNWRKPVYMRVHYISRRGICVVFFYNYVLSHIDISIVHKSVLQELKLITVTEKEQPFTQWRSVWIAESLKECIKSGKDTSSPNTEIGARKVLSDSKLALAHQRYETAKNTVRSIADKNKYYQQLKEGNCQ